MSQTPEQALEPYCLLAKQSKGRPGVGAKIVKDAVSHASTFLFGELLDMEGIKALENSDYKKEFNLLTLFAYGTYGDYKKNKENYPEPFDAKWLYKLKQLTVVTIASNQRSIPYALLQSELDLQNVREVEDLLIDCTYQGLITGKLDQKLSALEVYETIGRDITVNDIDAMISSLSNWNNQGKKIMEALESNTNEAIQAFEINKKHQTEYQEKVEDVRKSIKTAIEMQNEGNGMNMMMGGMGVHMVGDERRRHKGPR
ncbi:hypothetical protein AKO1_009978 [Acrasis kona]|uniref:PCI domain-containing protein n=1 Tax=Acrasis kona TaxID=1008807 RepID=A0AAW2ZPZ8_9EUKA